MALSSAGYEFYSDARCAAEVLGSGAPATHMEYPVPGTVRGDSAAALGVVRWFGVGELRHIDTSLLWVHQVQDEKRMIFAKVAGYVSGQTY